LSLALLLYPFILAAGALQALGNAMNACLRQRMVNPTLAAAASFAPIVGVFTLLLLAMPTPLPTAAGMAKLHWYDPFGGVAGAVAVFAGLALVDKVGSGPFDGLTITGNILTSLALDALGLFGLHGGGFRPLPWIGGAVMVAGVLFITLGEGKAADEDRRGGRRGAWLYPLIFAAGALQALGAVLNAELRGALANPWLAADVSFIPVLLIFATAFLLRPYPLPAAADLEGVRWWMPLAGITGAVAVFAGLLFVDKVGAGAFNGLLITANLLASLALDHFGWLGMRRAPFGARRAVGCVLMIAGIAVISVAR
jgi:bacterial/archaeal transporter family-2 protein